MVQKKSKIVPKRSESREELMIVLSSASKEIIVISIPYIRQAPKDITETCTYVVNFNGSMRTDNGQIVHGFFVEETKWKLILDLRSGHNWKYGGRKPFRCIMMFQRQSLVILVTGLTTSVAGAFVANGKGAFVASYNNRARSSL